MTPEAMVNLAKKVQFAEWQLQEAKDACAANGVTYPFVVRQTEIGEALEAWGQAMKWFIYKCVTPSGLVGQCFSYADRGPDGSLVCSFCGRKP